MKRASALAGWLGVALVAIYAVALGLPPVRDHDAGARSELMSLSATREIETFDNILDLVWLPFLLATLLACAYALLGRRVQGLAALGVLVGTSAVAYGLRWVLYELDPLGGEAQRVSDVMFFPSGHTAAVASTGLAAIILAPRDRRWIVSLCAGVGIAAIGVASVAEGSHYPSDVAGAYALALALACLVNGLAGGTLGARVPPALAAPTLAVTAALALAVLSVADGVDPQGLFGTGWAGGLAAGLLLLLGAGLPLAYLAFDEGSQPARNAEVAARKPHIPWTPPPGGVEDEQR